MNDSVAPIPRVHIVGRRNAGKTTLICELLEELSERGLRVATIKHTHHEHELDTPGKDSWKHRDAGAAAVGILSPRLIAAFIPWDHPGVSADRYERLSGMFGDCQLLLVEGDLHADGLKLEVWRPGLREPPYALSDTGIHAVISDVPAAVRQDVWPRTDVPALTDQILKLTHIQLP